MTQKHKWKTQALMGFSIVELFVKNEQKSHTFIHFLVVLLKMELQVKIMIMD